jgi:diphthine synthase
MSELVFIGLGLHDELGMSLRGQREAKSCDILLSEFYTSAMPGLDLGNLKALVGKEVVVLSRKAVEEDAEQTILSKARTGKVGLLIPGDPMVATTHVDLRLRALKAGIKTRIIHAASVTSAAAGATGLQSYKFGRSVTVPASWQGDLPESIYTSIRNNLGWGLHSLVLLEINAESETYVTIQSALKQLLAFSQREPDPAINSNTLVIGIARLEAPDMIVRASSISEILQGEFGGPPYALVFPGRLHFIEAEALHILCGAPERLVKANQ